MHGGETTSPVRMLNWPLRKIALDDIAVDVAFRKRTGPVRAKVVGDEEFTRHVEHRKRLIVDFNLERGARRNFGGSA